MTASYADRRALRSGAVLVAFFAAIVTLFWIWSSTQTSSAAFADREVFDRNHLGAGTVDIALGDDTVRFAALDLAAGDIATGQLELLNSGTLALRYTLSASNDGGALGDVLQLQAWFAPTCGHTPTAGAPVWLPLIDAVPGTSGAGAPMAGQLIPGESNMLCLAAVLPLSAPNSIQGSRLDVTLSVHAEHDLAEAAVGGES